MAEDFTAVINQLKQNNQAEAQRDSNLNQNIAFSRKDNKASLEKLSKAITGTTSAVKDADKEDGGSGAFYIYLKRKKKS